MVAYAIPAFWKAETVLLPQRCHVSNEFLPWQPHDSKRTRNHIWQRRVCWHRNTRVTHGGYARTQKAESYIFPALMPMRYRHRTTAAYLAEVGSEQVDPLPWLRSAAIIAEMDQRLGVPCRPAGYRYQASAVNSVTSRTVKRRGRGARRLAEKPPAGWGRIRTSSVVPDARSTKSSCVERRYRRDIVPTGVPCHP